MMDPATKDNVSRWEGIGAKLAKEQRNDRRWLRAWLALAIVLVTTKIAGLGLRPQLEAILQILGIAHAAKENLGPYPLWLGTVIATYGLYKVGSLRRRMRRRSDEIDGWPCN